MRSVTGLILALLVGCVALSCTVRKGYDDAILKSQEQRLRTALSQMRELINKYTLDHDKAPQSLNDLVNDGLSFDFRRGGGAESAAGQRPGRDQAPTLENVKRDMNVWRAGKLSDCLKDAVSDYHKRKEHLDQRYHEDLLGPVRWFCLQHSTE